VKKDWEVKKLREVCDLITCGLASTPKYVDSSNGIPFLSAQNVRNGKVVLDKYNYISKDLHAKLTKKNKPIKGDILYSRVGSKFGEAGVVEHDFEFSVYVSLTLIKTKKDVLNNFYLKYFLNSPEVKKIAKAGLNGAGVGNLNVEVVREFDIPLPSFEEQRVIVNKLDEIFKLLIKAKENTEKNLNNAREIFESYLQNLFRNPSWETSPLGQVCELKSGTTISLKLERNSGDILYTKIADMNLPENQIEINTSSRFVNSKEINKNQIIPEGSIIFPKRGGAIATNKKRKIIKPTIVDLNTMAIIPTKIIDKDFLFYWFQLIDLNEISNGTSIPQINNYSFDDVNISYPCSLFEQKEVVQKLDALLDETKKLQSIYQKKIENLEELKKSILEKAFNGELDTIKSIAV